MAKYLISDIEQHFGHTYLSLSNKILLYTLECNISTLLSFKSRYNKSKSKEETAFLSDQINRITSIINIIVDSIKSLSVYRGFY